MADSVAHRLKTLCEKTLGKRFDGRVNLSRGEWQKVALARAYMRDPQLLILDEPELFQLQAAGYR